MFCGLQVLGASVGWAAYRALLGRSAWGGGGGGVVLHHDSIYKPYNGFKLELPPYTNNAYWGLEMGGVRLLVSGGASQGLGLTSLNPKP